MFSCHFIDFLSYIKHMIYLMFYRWIELFSNIFISYTKKDQEKKLVKIFLLPTHKNVSFHFRNNFSTPFVWIYSIKSIQCKKNQYFFAQGLRKSNKKYDSIKPFKKLWSLVGFFISFREQAEYITLNSFDWSSFKICNQPIRIIRKHKNTTKTARYHYV